MKAELLFQDEKKQLKAKEEEEAKFKERANLFIPLVDEHSDDITMAKRTDFFSGSSKDERRKKRLEIKAQSVFESSSSGSKASSSDRLKSGGTSRSSVGHDKARQTLLKACGRMDTGILSSPLKGGHSAVTPTKDKRTLLGIRTAKDGWQ